MIARWKGIIEEIHFRGSIMPSDIIGNINIENHSFRPSKWLRKLKPAKNNKLSKLPECCFEPVGKAGWPSISRHMIDHWKGMIKAIRFWGVDHTFVKCFYDQDGCNILILSLNTSSFDVPIHCIFVSFLLNTSTFKSER
jgi:hypothetical protein